MERIPQVTHIPSSELPIKSKQPAVVQPRIPGAKITVRYAAGYHGAVQFPVRPSKRPLPRRSELGDPAEENRAPSPPRVSAESNSAKGNTLNWRENCISPSVWSEVRSGQVARGVPAQGIIRKESSSAHLLDIKPTQELLDRPGRTCCYQTNASHDWKEGPRQSQ